MRTSWPEAPELPHRAKPHYSTKIGYDEMSPPGTPVLANGTLTLQGRLHASRFMAVALRHQARRGGSIGSRGWAREDSPLGQHPTPRNTTPRGEGSHLVPDPFRTDQPEGRVLGDYPAIARVFVASRAVSAEERISCRAKRLRSLVFPQVDSCGGHHLAPAFISTEADHVRAFLEFTHSKIPHANWGRGSRVTLWPSLSRRRTSERHMASAFKRSK